MSISCDTIYIIMNIPQYLREVRVELTKVTWPTRKEATYLTLVILIASLATGGLDLLFTRLLGLFLK